MSPQYGRRLALCLVWLIPFILLGRDSDRENPVDEIIHDIQISGIDRTRAHIILGELTSQVGEPFRVENMEEDKSRLQRLGIFASVDVTAEPLGNGVIIKIHVVETTPILPTLRIQITDENGVALGGGVKHINLLGRALFGQLAGTFGQASTFEFILERPVFFRSPISYLIEYFHRERRNEVDDYFEKADEFFATAAVRLGGPFRIGARFMYQTIRSDTDGKTLSASNEDRVVTAGLFVGHDSRDAVMYTRTGWWNEIELNRSGLFGSDSDFWRLNVDLCRYLPLGSKGTLVVSSLTTLTSGRVGREIAPWQDFAIGGTNSVRGWTLDSRRGKNQMIHTVEYRHLLMKPRAYNFFGFSLPLGMQLALYADVGSAWGEPHLFSENFIAGAGLGLRFVVPVVGVSRLDVGFGERGVRIRLHLSSFEKTVRQRDRVR